jgi:hypothetical protein
MTIDWGTKVINIFKTDMLLVQASPTEIWELDIPNFKMSLGDLLDDEHGMIYPDIFKHNPEVSVGGVSLAKVIEILPPYTITFEDGQYAVNLVGANNNVGDRTNVNQVSIRSANSAGMITVVNGGTSVIDSNTITNIANTVWSVPKGNTVYQRSIGGFRKNYTNNTIIMLNEDGTDGITYACFDRYGVSSLTTVDRMELVP